MFKGFGKRPGPVTVFRVVPPQDGGWSLMPMENLLRGLRNERETISLELYGVDGIMNYCVRTYHSDSLNGMFRAYFSGANLTSHVMGEIPGDPSDADAGDWLLLDEHERAVVMPLGLARESYLPLRIFDDRVIQQAQTDPLAGLIGLLSDITMQSEYPASDRVGVRLVIRPAPEDWSKPWQKFMQARRDGDDKSPKMSPSQDSGPSVSTIIGLGLLAGLGGINWLLYQNGNIPGMVLFDGSAMGLGVLGYGAWKKFGGSSKRAYMDELLVEEKLKSLGFWAELQIVRIYREISDDNIVRKDLDLVMDCLRSFDDPAGNSWSSGKVQRFDGMSASQRDYGKSGVAHPFVGGSQVLGWLDPKRASRTVLSAHEVASVWHPPLGMSEMASMERIASSTLIPYLGELAHGDEDSGPIVGHSGTREVRLPESSIRKHAIILGRSGTGKSTLIKHIIDYKLRRKAQGKDDGAVVVVDPHADLVRDILQFVPMEVADKIRLLDFGRRDRVPGINLVDPYLFQNRDRCVDTIINTVRNLWEHWGGRLEDLLKNSLMIVYEFNCHPNTARSDMLTMLDILALLDDGVQTGSGRNQKTEMSQFQRWVLSRVSDPRLKQWFQSYLNWPRDTRAEAVGPVHSRIGAYAKDQRASVIMGQRESTIMLSDVLSEGLVLLVSTAAGTIGKGPAALMGGTIVSLVESALREQESMEASKRARCLLVCDEFQTVTGADWEGLFAEIRKYGCSLMLATQSLARLNTGERKLKEGVLGNVGVIVGYQMAAEDARIISLEMGESRVSDEMLVALNPHHCCVRINSDTTCYPTFSMQTLPPPEATRTPSPEAVAAIMAASEAYTVDWSEARAKMNQEIQDMLDGRGRFSKKAMMEEEADNASQDPGGSGASQPDGSTPSGSSGSTPNPEPDAAPSPGRGPAAGTPGNYFDVANSNQPPVLPPRSGRVSGPDFGVGDGPASFSDGPDAGPDAAAPARRPAPAAAAVLPAVVLPDAPARPGISRSPEEAREWLLKQKGVTEEHLRRTPLPDEVLVYLASPEGREDPAVEALIMSVMGRATSKAYQRGSAQAEREHDARVKAEVEAKVEAMMPGIVKEARMDARLELAAQFTASGLGSGRVSGGSSGNSPSGDSSRGPAEPERRDFGKFRPVVSTGG